MNTDHNAIAASLDAAQVSELAQLDDDAFWDYARRLAGVAPVAPLPSSTSSILLTPDAEALASHVNTPELASDSLSYLECILGEHRCLLPLAALVEIVPMPRYLTFLPAMPSWMLGLTAWRGEPVAVIDLENYLTDTIHAGDNRDGRDTSSVDRSSAGHEEMLLLIRHTAAPFGFFVGGAGAIMAIPSAQVAPVPVNALTWPASSRVNMFRGIHNGVIVLDVPMLLNALTRQIEMVAAHG